MKLWSWGEDVDELRRTLNRGGVLVLPTESSYGLGVDPRSRAGIEILYRLKRRDRGKPVPIVAADRDQLVALGVDLETTGAASWMAHWPAPLSLVLPCCQDLPASAGTGSLAVRIPDHERLRGLLEILGTALTATSANPSGLSPVLDPQELEIWLGNEDVAIVCDGTLPGGPPSTLIRPEPDGGWRLLREGRFPVGRVLT